MRGADGSSERGRGVLCMCMHVRDIARWRACAQGEPAPRQLLSYRFNLEQSETAAAEVSVDVVETMSDGGVEA